MVIVTQASPVAGVSDKDYVRVHKAILRTLSPHSGKAQLEQAANDNVPHGLTISQLASHVRPYCADWKLVLQHMQQQGEVISTSGLVARRMRHAYALTAKGIEEAQAAAGSAAAGFSAVSK